MCHAPPVSTIHLIASSADCVGSRSPTASTVLGRLPMAGAMHPSLENELVHRLGFAAYWNEGTKSFSLIGQPVTGISRIPIQA